MVSKCGHPPPRIVGQKLEVEQRAAPLGESRQDVFPAALALVAMGELNMSVLQGELVFGELFQPDNDVVGGGLCPRSFGDQRCSYLFEFLVIEYAFR